MRKTLLLKITLPLLLLLLAAGSASWLMAAKAKSEKAKVNKTGHVPPTVMVAIFKPEALRMDVHSQGVIAPRTEIALVSEVAGKVVKVHPAFAAGGFFKAGELLLAIDPHDYQFAVIRAKAAVAEAYKELLREQEEAQQAAEEWQALGGGKATDYVLHNWQGRIVRIASDLDDKNAMLYAIADIPDAFKAHDGHAPLLPGMFVHAVIAGIERSDLMRLPRSALRGGNQVYSVDKEERLRLHSIDILRSDKDHVIVTEGIAPGEPVLISGVDLPVDGMRVRVKSAVNSQQSAALPGNGG